MSLHYEPGHSAASFVDLISNATVLSGMALNADAGRVLSGTGTFPRRCLPAVLHESAHHYCFAMPVGHALSACFLEAIRTHLADAASDERDDHMAEALIRYDIVTAALRPLAEGIALYTEFDAAPGASAASISPPLSDVVALFGDALPPAWQGQPIAKVLGALLESARLSGDTIKRREVVLSQALIDDADGYLTGYWLVKNWRWHLIDSLEADALYDTDFYLQFIANYFYGDQQLAAMILDFDHYRIANLAGLAAGQEDFADAFLQYFQRRLRYLLLELQRADIDRIENVLASTSGYSFDEVQIALPGRVATSGAEIGEAIEALAGRFNEVEPPVLGSALVHILNSRRWIAYASFQASVRVLDNGRFVLGEGEHEYDRTMPVMGGVLQAPQVLPGEGDGVFELVSDRGEARPRFRRFVWRGTELLAAIGELAPDDPQSYLVLNHADASLPIFSTSYTRELVIKLSAEMRAAFDEMSVGPVVAADCLAQMRDLRAGIYAKHLAPFVFKNGAEVARGDLRLPLPVLCDGHVAALRIAAATGIVDGGLLAVGAAPLTSAQADVLAACPLQLVIRRGNLAAFRF
ncbi:hypothetical protein SAMN05428959_102431 [Duganella sp. CF517]|uniref:hypothetical protein n=1 Tax=Duganella sp. CF517 TaxID=1881038 RepID=UPI0008D2EC89|nr:hypothetical protein [Duganella sp. CF517]SEN56915.1 hypothetical protein SAMN05428959_102431 [Duganella sp. CF517]